MKSMIIQYILRRLTETSTIKRSSLIRGINSGTIPFGRANQRSHVSRPRHRGTDRRITPRQTKQGAQQCQR